MSAPLQCLQQLFLAVCTVPTMHISNGQIDRDLVPIQSLLNQIIATSTALYDYHPRPLDQVHTWFTDKVSKQLPIRIAHDEQGQFLGFSTYGPFRPHPAYKYTAEHSIYVADHARGKGVGLRLLEDIIEQASIKETRVLIGAIDADNLSSIALHKKLGFVQTGLLPEAGFKFGRWLNLILLQKKLPGPRQPCDG